MSKRLRRIIAISALAFATVGAPATAWAGHNQGPGCHGANQVPCRPDPQPTHGNDCGSNSTNPLNSDDHCGDIPL